MDAYMKKKVRQVICDRGSITTYYQLFTPYVHSFKFRFY